MEYHKITNLLEKTIDQPSKFRIRKWVEINHYTNNGEYNPGNQIRFCTAMLESRFCNYSDAYVFMKGAITNATIGAGAAV